MHVFLKLFDWKSQASQFQLESRVRSLENPHEMELRSPFLQTPWVGLDGFAGM